MMPTVEGMSPMIPSHVLRVGQTISLGQDQQTLNQHARLAEPGCNHDDQDLDISLDNLNRLIMELDPTFEPIQVERSPTSLSPSTGFAATFSSQSSDDMSSPEEASHCMLVARGCPLSYSVMPSTSPSIPIPSPSDRSCSPLPLLLCGSAPRRIPSPRQDAAFPHGSLRLSPSNRNSAASLFSTSTCSDTSYLLGSNLSLASEDADSPESILTHTSGSFTDVQRMKGFDSRHSPEKTSLTKHRHLLEISVRGAQSSPSSLSGSWTDIPVLLINGAPEPRGPEPYVPQRVTVSSSKPLSPHSFHVNGNPPSMKFVMDTSKFWFRPHINRAEADAMVKHKEAGTFVVRDSTSFRGCFGLAMKVENSIPSPGAHPAEENTSDPVRHFLIESSAKGVRIKGSSQEPYFGSLSALVYQHTISAYALPCKLLLHSEDAGAEERLNDKPTSEDTSKTASNFVYLNAVPTEMLTGPCAVRKAVSATFEKKSGSFTPTVVNMKVSSKGVTLTDINRKLFFRRHYPAHLLSHGSEDPDSRRWIKGSSFGAMTFGFVTKGIESGMENVCHVFAEYDPLQPCGKIVAAIQAAIVKPQRLKD